MKSEDIEKLRTMLQVSSFPTVTQKQILEGQKLLDKELICPQYRLSVTQYNELKEKADKCLMYKERCDKYEVKSIILEQENKQLKETIQKVRELDKNYKDNSHDEHWYRVNTREILKEKKI